MKFRHKALTIKKEIFLMSFAFLATVSLVFSGVFLHILYRKNMENAGNSLRECNAQIVIYTEGMFHENESIVNILSRADTIVNGGSGNPAAVLKIYDAILKDNSNITYIYSGYADGRLYINNYDIPDNYDPTDRPWYQAAVASDGVARLVYEDAANGEWLFSQSKKLVDDEGNVVGAVSVDCSNELISRQLSTRYQYASQRSFITDLSGKVLIHPDERYINDTILNYMEKDSWDKIIAGKVSYGEYQKNGIKAMAYFEQFPGTDFIVCTAINAREVTQPIVWNMVHLLFMLAGLSLLFGFLLSRVLLYRFGGPILELKRRIENVVRGCPEEYREAGFYNAELNGIADSITIIVKNIAKKEEQRKEAEYTSFHDSMTGLYNRRFFSEELRRLDVKRNYPLCIICCDVNGLKLVNDVFGHDVGDQLICRVAESLAGVCRADDILARVGGDEFALLLSHTSEEDAEGIIARIREGFPAENIRGAQISASFGYGVKKKKEDSIAVILRSADQMMYRRKLTESEEMKQQTVANIIEASAKEGLVTELTEKEEHALEQLSADLCPGDEALLKQAYRLRKIGLCSLFQSNMKNEEEIMLSGINRRHTDNSYRILSASGEYRGAAGYVLHYTEHWDGSGWPAGLAGRDIPLLSRVIAAVDAFVSENSDGFRLKQHDGWYDPEITALLQNLSEDGIQQESAPDVS